MTFNIRFIACTALLALSSLSYAGGASFRISNDTIGGGIDGQIGETDLVAGFEHFYKDESESVNISNINLHTQGQTAISNLPTTVLLGLEATHMKEGEFKASAVAFGGAVRINLPSTPGLSVETRLHYAPDILAYGDSDEFKRFRAQLNYRVIQSADLSLGYQYLNAGIKDAGDRTFESGYFIGLGMKF
ncbi:MAG: YfaZ family protein [Oleiphilaceae bacterium]|uniref:YfaZ family outer membrane protein n=1 Tax=Oleiphilus sp. HI0125 TaxID=1822266 RepID=UPI000ABEEF70|nr:YfaZ family outer membrane protein [Oleiphilus sp. HI0125]MCH2159397.1 YfaZ family protein [Oleiphilaceae bacterium]